MGEYRYEIPEGSASSEWEHMSNAARQALGGMAVEPSVAQLIEEDEKYDLQTVLDWANDDLASTIKYVPLPHSVDELRDHHKNLEPTLMRLYGAKRALMKSGHLTPSGDNIGNAMRLVVVPYKVFQKNQDDIEAWMRELRAAQGIPPDTITPEVQQLVHPSTALYVNDAHPRASMTNKNYLIRRLATEGSMGLLLVQTGDEAGLETMMSDSWASTRNPNDLTNNWHARFSIAEQHVDALGIYEWLALTMQYNPEELSTKDQSWLLANRYGWWPTQNETRGVVPYGAWTKQGVVISQASEHDNDRDIRPRLAVK